MNFFLSLSLKSADKSIIFSFEYLATLVNKVWEEPVGNDVNSKSISDDESEYLELEFVPNTNDGNITYTRNTVSYTSFKIFAIKIVMTAPSSETTRVPLIKDLRTIALA